MRNLKKPCVAKMPAHAHNSNNNNNNNNNNDNNKNNNNINNNNNNNNNNSNDKNTLVRPQENRYHKNSKKNILANAAHVL